MNEYCGKKSQHTLISDLHYFYVSVSPLIAHGFVMCLDLTVQSYLWWIDLGGIITPTVPGTAEAEAQKKKASSG